MAISPNECIGVVRSIQYKYKSKRLSQSGRKPAINFFPHNTWPPSSHSLRQIKPAMQPCPVTQVQTKAGRTA